MHHCLIRIYFDQNTNTSPPEIVVCTIQCDTVQYNMIQYPGLFVQIHLAVGESHCSPVLEGSRAATSHQLLYRYCTYSTQFKCFEKLIPGIILRLLTFSSPQVTSQILLCLTPDDFTVKREGDPLGLKRLKNYLP